MADVSPDDDVLTDLNALTKSLMDAYNFDNFPNVSHSRLEELKKAFVPYDNDLSGFIKSSNLKHVLRKLSPSKLDEREVKRINRLGDPNKSGIIPFTRFVRSMETFEIERPDLYTPEAIEERQKSFALFEINSSGKMKASHLKSALDYIGKNYSSEQALDTAGYFGIKPDGELDFETFTLIIAGLQNPDDMPFRVSELRKNECEEVFTLFEHEESGMMKADELIYAVRCIGITTDEEELKEIISGEGLTGEELLDKEQFMKIMALEMKKHNLDQDPSKLNEDEVKELRDAFSLFDNDGDGNITISELGGVMKSLGRNLSHKKLKELVAEVDTDGNGTIEFQELLDLMEHNTVRNSFMDEMRRAFKHFDRDGNGFISPDELRKALSRMKIKLTKIEFVLMLKRVDSDKDGQVSFKEFVIMMITDNN